MNNFTEENFVFDIDSPAPEYFYEKGGEELPAWSLFTSLSFSLYEKYEGNNDVGGSFFQYLTKETVPKRVVEVDMLGGATHYMLRTPLTRLNTHL